MTETALVRYCYSAAVIRSADGALLIVQRAATEDFQPNYWELPGGHAEDGESIQAALRREVREETKLNIYVPALIPYFGFIYGDQNNMVALHFMVEAEGEPVLNPAEHQAFKWIRTVADLDGLHISAVWRQSLERALGMLSPVTL